MANANASNLLRVVVTIDGRRFDEDLAFQAKIAPDIESLNNGLAEHPGRFAEWAMLEALASEQHDIVTGKIDALDGDIKELEAELFLMYQKDLTTLAADGKVKEPTLDRIKANITLDPRRKILARDKMLLCEEQVKAKAAHAQLTVGRKTMDKKHESLLAIASNWRQEMDSNLVGIKRRMEDLFRPRPAGGPPPAPNAANPGRPPGIAPQGRRRPT